MDLGWVAKLLCQRNRGHYIGDKHRFPNSRSVGTYLGLVRRLDISGNSDRELRMTKAGNEMLRRLLVQAAHFVLGPFGPDTTLRRWGLNYIDRSGGCRTAKKKATVAVARKLAVLLHRLWVTGEVYEPLRGDAGKEIPNTETGRPPSQTPGPRQKGRHECEWKHRGRRTFAGKDVTFTLFPAKEHRNHE